MAEILSYLGALGIGTLIGVTVPPFLNHWLARRRFVQEQWWNRKLEAYVALQSALNDMLRFDQAVYDDLLNVDRLSDQRRSELWDLWRAGRRQLDDALFSGRFLLSAQANDALRAVVEARRNVPEENIAACVDAEAAAIKDCIPRFTSAASKDLRVKLSLLSPQ